MSNFHDLILNIFGPDELEARFSSIVNRLGAEKISTMSVRALCREIGYGSIRDCLNASPFTPWEIGIVVESAFTLSDLDHAVANYDSFLIHGFDLRVPKAGVLSAYVAYEQAEFSINFQFRPSPKWKRDERLVNAIAELAQASSVRQSHPDFEVMGLSSRATAPSIAPCWPGRPDCTPSSDRQE